MRAIPSADQAPRPRFPADLDGQFLIGRGPLPPCEGTRLERLETLEVQLHPGCRALRVSDAGGTPLGLLIGAVIDFETRTVPRAEIVLPRALPADGDIDAFIEEALYRLGGSFLFVLDHGPHARVYLDAGGTRAAVFDPGTGRVAATTPLLLDPESYAERFDSALYDTLNIPRDGWFPAGLTAHAGITRLIPNHYFDFATLAQHRHWPRAALPEAEPAAACREIAEVTRRTVETMRAEGRVAAALTAGNETRTLLAACRDLAGTLDFVTVSGTAAHLDAVRAGEIAARFGLTHRVLPRETASPEAAADWHARTGQCLGGTTMRAHPSIAPLAADDYFVGGIGGEVGRGFFWRPGDTAATALDARSLAMRLGMPVHDRETAAIEDWLAGVGGFDTFTRLDLAFLELRLGPWAFSDAYATPKVRHFHPLVARRSFAAMLSLPAEWRRADRMPRTIVEMLWPDLLALPVNRYGDYRDTLHLARRALAEPHLVAKVFRKRFG
jgi:hypothetical protein